MEALNEIIEATPTYDPQLADDDYEIERAFDDSNHNLKCRLTMSLFSSNWRKSSISVIERMFLLDFIKGKNNF